MQQFIVVCASFLWWLSATCNLLGLWLAVGCCCVYCCLPCSRVAFSSARSAAYKQTSISIHAWLVCDSINLQHTAVKDIHTN